MGTKTFSQSFCVLLAGLLFLVSCAGIAFNMMNMMMKIMARMMMIREGFKNPRHGNFPLGGYPPHGASTDKIFPKS